MGLDVPEWTLKQTSGDYLVIEHNGDVYSCEFLSSRHGDLAMLLMKSLSICSTVPFNGNSAREKLSLKKSVKAVAGLNIVTDPASKIDSTIQKTVI